MQVPEIVIPPALRQNRLRNNGEVAQAWLDSLPALAQRVAEDWGLTIEAPFPDLSYNYVTRVRRADGSPAVLKLCLPDTDMRLEAAALAGFDGRGCVRLLQSDLDAGVLLLELVQPGTPVWHLGDDSAEIGAAAALMRELWRRPPQDNVFPHALDWVHEALMPDAIRETKLANPWLEPALRTVAERADPRGDVLLHGDLHHNNILASAEDAWVAIDPKGVVGDRAWELAPFIFNRLGIIHEADWLRAARRGADQFAEELSLERESVYAWSAVRSIQSAFWSLRDYADASTLFRAAVICAEELAKGP
ncbi:MAG TPA: aminoglycoside phosphotransferase family protein [Dehalococcoidia bacterium]|nr:aminoglycoside phosphotransferase family protein [Dehalococcoidia bacterium]